MQFYILKYQSNLIYLSCNLPVCAHIGTMCGWVCRLTAEDWGGASYLTGGTYDGSYKP